MLNRLIPKFLLNHIKFVLLLDKIGLENVLTEEIRFVGCKFILFKSSELCLNCNLLKTN
jgi:hypothetical protein